MTNPQLYIAIGLPMLAVLASMVLNLFTAVGIREGIGEIHADIREIRSDIKLMTGKIADVDTRLSLIEERVK